MQKWIVAIAVMVLGCGDGIPGQAEPDAPGAPAVLYHATNATCTSSHDEDGDGIPDDCDPCPTIARGPDARPNVLGPRVQRRAARWRERGR
jgi:hypothetical protein